MRRHLLWMAALMLSALVPAYQMAAQESAGASGGATAETNQSDASASGTADGSATEGQSQSDASTSGSAEADAQTSGSASDQSASQSTSAGTSDSQPATSEGAQSTSDINTNQRPQGTTTVPAPQQPRTDSSQQTPQHDAAGQNNQADVAVQGRARSDARTQQNNQEALQRGLQFGQATNRGLAINEVEQNSIYYRSGFRRGDVIVSLFGRPVRRQADFMRFILMHPGQRVPVIVLRNGRQQTIYVEYPQEIVQRQHIYTPQAGGAYLGVMFNAQVRDAAVVLSVNRGSPAEEAGLQADDTILAMNGQEIRSYPDVISLVRTMRPGQEVDIVIARGQSEMQVFAVLDAHANVRTATRPGEVQIQQAPVDRRTQIDVDVNRRSNDARLRDRDRNNDGNPDRRLLPRLRN